MSHRRWLSPTESLLVISVEEDAFLTAHGIDQHEVYDALGRTPEVCIRAMAHPVNARYRVAIGVQPCAGGHAMCDRLGRCVMCNPSVLDAAAPAVVRAFRLTHEEAAFLAHHGIAADKVYDAEGTKRSVYGPVMREKGYVAAVNVTRCIHGHALRDRKGKCLVCNPAILKFRERHTAAGWVYLAYSRAGRIYKVGSSADIDDRFEQLNIHRYGGRDDWQLVEQCWCAEAGRSEHNVQSLLAEHGVEGDYGGRPEYCRELYRCNRKVALAALRAGVTR